MSFIGLRFALREWRRAEKNHALIVLGEKCGNKIEAKEVTDRALHELRKIADGFITSDFDAGTSPNDKSSLLKSLQSELAESSRISCELLEKGDEAGARKGKFFRDLLRQLIQYYMSTFEVIP